MYRDGYEAAAAELAKSAKQVVEREGQLDEAIREKLPTKILARLTSLKAKLTPVEQTVEAVQACERGLRDYEYALTDALNLAAQIRGAEERGETLELTDEGVPLAHSAARRWFARLSVLGLLFGAFAYLPEWLIDRAEASSVACFESLPASHDEPESCRERVLLLWPLAVPWKHEAALAEWRSTAAQVADLVVSRDLDGADRDARARALLERDPGRHAYKLALQGAFRVLADSDVVDLAGLQAAATLVDLDAVKRHAASMEALPPSTEADAARGSWLCLLGEREAGLAALVRADETYRNTVTKNGVGWNRSRLALVACGGTPAELGFSPFDTSDYGREAMTMLRLADPSWQKGRRRAVLREMRDNLEGETSALAAYALADGGELTWSEALVWVAPDSVNGAFEPPTNGLTPWGIHSPGALNDDGRVAPAVFEAAARQSARLAKAAPVSSEKPTRYLGSGNTATEAAYQEPKKTLLNATWLFGWHAAVGYARWGKRDEALAALEAVKGVIPEGERWHTAAVHIAVRDHEGALRKLEAAPKASELGEPERFYLELNRAYALAGLGRFEEAHAAARQAAKNASANVYGSDGESAALVVATALAANKAPDIALGTPELDTTVDYESSIQRPWVAGWLALISKPSEERAKLRMRVPAQGLLSRFNGAPAAFFIAGRMVDDPTNGEQVEMWLDRVFSVWHLKGRSTAAIAQARAEAARWRGDPAAAEIWQKRADTLFALIDSHDKAILADASGDN